MDTKTTNPLSRYFGEMDKKPVRNAALKGIFDQIQAPKSDWGSQPVKDEGLTVEGRMVEGQKSKVRKGNSH